MYRNKLYFDNYQKKISESIPWSIVFFEMSRRLERILYGVAVIGLMALCLQMKVDSDRINKEHPNTEKKKLSQEDALKDLFLWSI